FQYDSASSYGGIGIVDDTSSIYTANTQDNASSRIIDGNNNHTRNGIDEDFDAVLDDLKDEGAVDLSPHACRYLLFYSTRSVVKCLICSKRFFKLQRNSRGNTSASHIVNHLVAQNTRRCRNPPKVTPECYNCGSKNIFMLCFI
ncbi:hypothetical protein BDP27DRAFT_1157498, partial [Rhodocollybia butyracea]